MKPRLLACLLWVLPGVGAAGGLPGDAIPLHLTADFGRRFLASEHGLLLLRRETGEHLGLGGLLLGEAKFGEGGGGLAGTERVPSNFLRRPALSVPFARLCSVALSISPILISARTA